MSKHSIVRRIKMIGVYLLVAAVAALGWLWCALPEEVYLEPEQMLTLPRFGWVEPLRGHGSRNVASTRAAGSYQTTLALGGWLPVKTIREMISNAVCHRSYLTPGKIQVALFDDRLEVTSPGMLDSEITIEKMKSGLSKIRNRGIAAAFSYMNIVEAWGSGIPKMFREAKEYGLREPELIDMGSDFRINLYRKKAAIDQNGVIDPKERDTNDTKVDPNDTNEEAILSIILKNPQATQGAIAKEVEASLSTVKRIMRSLQKSGKLRREGTNRNGSWVVTGQKE